MGFRPWRHAHQCQQSRQGSTLMGTGAVEANSSMRTIGIFIVLQPPLLSLSPTWPGKGCEDCTEPCSLLQLAG